MAPCAPVSAGFVELEDRDAWFAAVGEVTTIDFTGFPDGTFITDQYAKLGVTFTDGNDNIFLSGAAFPNDGAGLDGNGDINVSFDEPQAWLAVDHPGSIKIQLFFDGQLVFDGPKHFEQGAGHFHGVIAMQPFDAARLIGIGSIEVDDLHFGVPSPGALWLLAVAAVAGRHRRRPPPRGGENAQSPAPRQRLRQTHKEHIQ